MLYTLNGDVKLSTKGEGVKKVQKMVHVVCARPLLHYPVKKDFFPRVSSLYSCFLLLSYFYGTTSDVDVNFFSISGLSLDEICFWPFPMQSKELKTSAHKP